MASSHHIVIFPFMSKGHIIPILHLSRLLLRRGATITIITTPSNSPFISQSLSHSHLTILPLPFPGDVPGHPPGVESTDNFPSMSLFLPFVNATKLMQPDFDQALQTLHPPVTCIISDGFLGWAVASAKNLGVPRLVYYGMSNFAMALSQVVVKQRLISNDGNGDEPFTVPPFPWMKLTRNDFEPPFDDPNPKGPLFEFVIEQAIATAQSQGILVNSFYSLEPTFLEYMNKEGEPKSWCVGPFCLAEEKKIINTKKWWIEWLDKEVEEGKSVLYVAFGTQAKISSKQIREILKGLEKSGVSFLWAVKRSSPKGVEDINVVKDDVVDEDELLFKGFEERVKERGVVVREWVEQEVILGHEGVKGFMSHCGWNSVMESICAGVPMVAWPMMAEQHLNARMVVEELGIGVRVTAENGSVRGFVKAEMVEDKVKELMEGERGKEARKKVKELAELAKEAVEEGGSSWRTLDALLEEIISEKKEE